MMKRKIFLLSSFFFLLFLSACTLVVESPELTLEGEVKLHFIDVGQGDSVLIQGTAGQNVLYDAGRNDNDTLSYLQDLGVETLDLVIASHPDADHIGGLDAVIDFYKPRLYMDNGVVATTQTYESLLTAVKNAGSQLVAPIRRTIALGNAQLLIIPPPLDPDFDRNNNSIGIMIDFGSFEAALTGDAEDDEFDWWLDNTPQYLEEVEVYKSSHHGSKNGDSEKSVTTFSPETVVIGVSSTNSFGHPSQEALALYASVEAKVYRTDQQGNVVISATSDGRYRVTTEK